MISIAVCDDEMLACCQIAGKIKKYLDDRGVAFQIQQFYQGNELLQTKEHFDIVFLDILMDELDGMQTAAPMHVYKEASRRGDTGTMERAMGYVTEFSERAVDCKEMAEEEMKEEAEEMRALKQQRLEESIEKAREEKLDAEKQIQMPEVEDALEISPEGKSQYETSVEYNLVAAKLPESDGGQLKAMMYTSKGESRVCID